MTGHACSDHHDANTQCRIEMYHSAEQNIVYLNLVSIHDTFVLADMLEKLEKDTNQTVREDDLFAMLFDAERPESQDIHMLLEKKEYHHLKAMLFMFHVCHFMLVFVHLIAFACLITSLIFLARSSIMA